MSSGVVATLPYESARLRFRLLRPDDLPAFYSYRANPDVARLQGWSLMSREEAEVFIQEQASVRTLDPGCWAQFAIASKDEDALIGDIGICLSAGASEAEFGLTISPQFQGRGLGTEAVRGIVAFLFQDRAIRSVVASTDDRNAPCLGALKSAGMRMFGSNEATYKGELCLEHLFRIERVDD